MSQIKQPHTPGPLHHEWNEEDGCFQVVADQSDDVLAMVFTDVESKWPLHDGEANSRLYAAAPELLRVCEFTLSSLKTGYESQGVSLDEAPREIQIWVRDLESVIAKAYGEEKSK